jgi:hypothetical protein
MNTFSTVSGFVHFNIVQAGKTVCEASFFFQNFVLDTSPFFGWCAINMPCMHSISPTSVSPSKFATGDRKSINISSLISRGSLSRNFFGVDSTFAAVGMGEPVGASCVFQNDVNWELAISLAMVS